MISLWFQKDQSNFCVKNGPMVKNRSRKTSWEATDCHSLSQHVGDSEQDTGREWKHSIEGRFKRHLNQYTVESIQFCSDLDEDVCYVRA